MRLPRNIQNYGSDALLLEWEQRIDPDINLSVHHYAETLRDHPAVVESVAAYNSLLVRYDPSQLDAYQLREWIYDHPATEGSNKEGKIHRLPVVYGGEYGPDLAATAKSLKLSQKKLIELHTATTYLVYQMGFQPGFAFLGLTDKKLSVDRREAPRTMVPAGSVGLAGRQTAVYPSSSPGGWQIIGRCPARLWDASKFRANRLQAGDHVKFYAVQPEEWAALEKKTASWKV